ncbi:hypothetical protein UFOVP837_47 [uncultured Caudovirales phage]|uniref:Uncharacterized protein n=1 Tax=uncultured Caudovirales phage TaxID=2100421 RepID=A0A6J5P4N8_9CAUD|nr:hypothetical protein UFOVP837_47 [uncultured Caudovirales phage]
MQNIITILQAQALINSVLEDDANLFTSADIAKFVAVVNFKAEGSQKSAQEIASLVLPSFIEDLEGTEEPVESSVVRDYTMSIR